MPIPDVDQSRKRYLSAATVKNEELDPIFQDKLNELKDVRNKAADADNYDKARFLRDAEDKIKEYGVKVL